MTTPNTNSMIMSGPNTLRLEQEQILKLLEIQIQQEKSQQRIDEISIEQGITTIQTKNLSDEQWRLLADQRKSFEMLQELQIQHYEVIHKQELLLNIKEIASKVYLLGEQQISLLITNVLEKK